MNVDIPNLDNRGLRKFGLVTGAIIIFLFALLFPWLLGRSVPLWPLFLAFALWLPAVLMPAMLRPVYSMWMKLGLMLGWVNSRIILSVLYYAIIVPFGLVMRILAKDPMRRKFDATVDSYRVKSHRVDRDRLEKPF